jgi:hypothetical protein
MINSRREFLHSAAVLATLAPIERAFGAALWQVADAPTSGKDFPLVDKLQSAAIYVEPGDHTVVHIAAGLLADDIERVTGRRPTLSTVADASRTVVIAGTLGRNAVIDRLISENRLHRVEEIKGVWEATLTQIIDKPFPDVDRAFVIVGSDRRGTAYGLLQLSEQIGVSPFYWWADVPVTPRKTVSIKYGSAQTDNPAVKYRGIFINDEAWGFAPWSAKTLEPELGTAGPKTYAKVFELMLRLRLNYIWPAMWKVGEFGNVPGNPKIADDYAIVAGSSHCEPMLYNNIHWDTDVQGPWNWALNRKLIQQTWENTAKERGEYEAVWPLGIRGIHDHPMAEPPSDLAGKLSVLTDVIHTQEKIIERNVSKKWGPVAQAFVPYMEVLPVYDAGLEVPPDATVVWVDDNFGYIRRLSSKRERARSGGSGVYYHMSYFGGPHGYDWINTTAPALCWNQMQKAWENEARTIWVVNVGNVKPTEIGMDFWARLAWAPETFKASSQPGYLHDFAARNFGERYAGSIADLLMEFYCLGTARKPEVMNREWAISMSAADAASLETRYRALLERDKAILAILRPGLHDVYVEMVGFPAQLIAAAGLIFLLDRKIQEGLALDANREEMQHWYAFISAGAESFNSKLGGGKWNHIMPRLPRDDRGDAVAWNSQVRWPWNEDGEYKDGKDALKPNPLRTNHPPEGQGWRDAASYDRETHSSSARWTVVDGLGRTGRAMSLQPAAVENAWSLGDKTAPNMTFEFRVASTEQKEAFIDFLPTFRLVPGMKLRVAIQVDNGPLEAVEVPGSDTTEPQWGPARQFLVLDNFARASVSLGELKQGDHSFKIWAVDPGAVIDRISLP